ncbi:MAG: hypothetical protein R3195_20030 [Gemmatimonadota bacterium]|nr:hypothetical protein [Gemmatimonadota bacterium]
MNAWKKIPIATALLLAGGVAPAAAQVGPIIDWISKLSGPGVGRFGLEATFPFGDTPRSLAVSPSGMYGANVGTDGDGPDTADGLGAWSGQATLDIPTIVFSPTLAILIRPGVGYSSFSGDNFETFGAFSIPLLATLRVGSGARGSFRIGFGWNFFSFPDDTFDPIEVGTEPGTWEGSFGMHASYIFDF